MLAGASRDPRVAASPRRATTRRRSGCLGRFVGAGQEEDRSVFPDRPTSRSRGLVTSRCKTLEASAFFTTRSCPSLTGEARLTVARSVSLASFDERGGGSPTAITLERGRGPTAAPEDDHCDSNQLAD